MGSQTLKQCLERKFPAGTPLSKVDARVRRMGADSVQLREYGGDVPSGTKSVLVVFWDGGPKYFPFVSIPMAVGNEGEFFFNSDDQLLGIRTTHEEMGP
jgi:hypothetical protein